ncbi:MAG: aldehyde dehydrogenase, partial [Micrococcales bacterium]|nr:aldehyde dehydrogenase [Micrococcales bacterium]
MAATTVELPLPEHAELDAQLQELTKAADRWRRTSAASRAALMREVNESVGRVAAEWAYAASRMKAIPLGSPLEGEEWQSGPYGALTATTVLAESLQKLADGRSPLDNETFGQAIGGRVTVRALPRTRAEGTI